MHTTSTPEGHSNTIHAETMDKNPARQHQKKSRQLSSPAIILGPKKKSHESASTKIIMDSTPNEQLPHKI
jgi:hypothetical protein